MTDWIVDVKVHFLVKNKPSAAHAEVAVRNLLDSLSPQVEKNVLFPKFMDAIKVREDTGR